MAEEMKEGTSVTGRKMRPGKIKTTKTREEKKVFFIVIVHCLCFRFKKETGGSTGTEHRGTAMLTRLKES